jgi:RNA polymerase sigma-70 factor, ECF subfamily
MRIGAITLVAGGIPAREMESARIDIEHLLRESRWLRRLAGHLVADPAEADDVAQETRLAALVSPPPVDREVRPWLTRVARNVIRSRYRADRRRRRREQAILERTEVPAPDQLLEQVELQRLLAELVAELPEPYRAVIVLRFYHDRSAADIAAAEGVPGATIRWRIQRGLQLLRDGLDRRHGGRADWRPALVGLADVPRPTAQGSGTSAMGPLTPIAAKLGLVFAAVVAVCALAALVIDLRSDTAPALAAMDRRAASQQAARQSRVSQPNEESSGRWRIADQAPVPAAPRDGRRDRPASEGARQSTESDVAEPRVTEMVWPLSSVDVEVRLQELGQPIAECVDAALERNPALNSGVIFEIGVVADPEVGAVVETAELLPVAGDPPDQELVECVRETTFAVELERPHWFVGRTTFHFPIALGLAEAEPYSIDGPGGPIGRALRERMRQIRRRLN